jgi:hypothetical protein
MIAVSKMLWSHIYMEAQVFSPNSRQLIVQCAGTAHTKKHDPENHRYMLVNFDQPDELIPLTDEINAKAPSFCPSGNYISGNLP